MKWLEISVYTTDEGLDYVCAALDGAGITGQSIEPDVLGTIFSKFCIGK